MFLITFFVCCSSCYMYIVGGGGGEGMERDSSPQGRLGRGRGIDVSLLD